MLARILATKGPPRVPSPHRQTSGISLLGFPSVNPLLGFTVDPTFRIHQPLGPHFSDPSQPLGFLSSKPSHPLSSKLGFGAGDEIAVQVEDDKQFWGFGHGPGQFFCSVYVTEGDGTESVGGVEGFCGLVAEREWGGGAEKEEEEAGLGALP